MAAKFIEIRVSDGETFGSNSNNDDQLYFPKTHVDQVVNLLDNNHKINIGLLPAFIFGGQKFFDTVSTDTSAGALFKSICTGASVAGLDDLNLFAGRFFQAGGNVEVTLGELHVNQGDDPTVYQYLETTANCIITFLCEPDDGVTEPTAKVVLESNDYLVFKKFIADADGGTAFFGVVNNTYTDATTDLKGVVQLATSTGTIDWTNNTKAITPAGAKKAVQEWGYTHDDIAIDADGNIGQLSNLRTITNIGLSADGNHIEYISTDKIPTANTGNQGVVKLATDTEAKSAVLAPYEDGYAVSPLVAKAMIDYWGRVDYFATLALANAHPTKSVLGKMVLVGVS